LFPASSTSIDATGRKTAISFQPTLETPIHPGKVETDQRQKTISGVLTPSSPDRLPTTGTDRIIKADPMDGAEHPETRNVYTDEIFRPKYIKKVLVKDKR